MALFHITVETTARRVLEVEAHNRQLALDRYNSDFMGTTEHLREVENECLAEEIMDVEKIE